MPCLHHKGLRKFAQAKRNKTGTSPLIPRKDHPMTDNPKTEPFSNAEKDPDDWTTATRR